MEIIYISHWRFPSEKAHSAFAMKTCEGFASAGHDVELWIPLRRNPAFRGIDPFRYHGIEKHFIIRRIPAIDLFGLVPGVLPFFLLLLSFTLCVFVLVLLRPRALLYFHDVRDAFFISFLRRPMILEIHDFYRSRVGWINRLVFRRISGFIVTNRLKIQSLKSDFGIPAARMLHQPNAVDIGLFAIDIPKDEARKRLSLPSERRIILYSGHLFGWKGVDTLFEAHRFLNKDELIYFVGGTDEDIETFKVKKEKLKVGNVAIVGRRPHGEIPVWLRAADIVVLPNTAKEEASRVETSPVKLFEYMASGRPIVASDLPSIRDVVDDSLVFFARPDDPRSIAATIQYIFLHPDEADERARRARTAAREHSWEKRRDAILGFCTSFMPEDSSSG